GLHHVHLSSRSATPVDAENEPDRHRDRLRSPASRTRRHPQIPCRYRGSVDHAAPQNLTRTAISATLHCLTGCAIGEVLGMVLATAFGWGNALSIAVAIVLAFFFGYSLTISPVLRAGVSFRRALPIAFAS